MPAQQIIHFKADNIKLTGTLHLPDAKHPPFVIGCHGLLADRSSPKQIALAKALNQIGIAYFRFDHRGCGDSQGEFDTQNLLTSRCSDLYHAIHTMESHSSLGGFAGLFGSSFGGTVVIATAAQTKVPLLATYAAPVSSRSIKKPSANEIQGKAPIVHTTPALYEFDISTILSKVSNILVMHGEKDEIVPVEHANQIYLNSNEIKMLVIHEGGDHRMTHSIHQKDFLKKCLNWFRPMLI